MITTVWVRKDDTQRLFPNLASFFSSYAFKSERDVENAHLKAEYILEMVVNHVLFGEDLLAEAFALIGFDEAILFRGEDESWTAIHYRDLKKGTSQSIDRIVGDEANTLFQQVSGKQEEVNQSALQDVMAGVDAAEQHSVMAGLLSKLPSLFSGGKK